jgi:hypothetical protein
VGISKKQFKINQHCPKRTNDLFVNILKSKLTVAHVVVSVVVVVSPKTDLLLL